MVDNKLGDIMEKLKLSWIEKAVKGTIINNREDERKQASDVLVKGVSIDSRTINSGDVYIAIIGESMDGHQFCQSAVDNGAVALIVQQHQAIDIPQIVVSDTKEALVKMATSYRDRYSPFVVGVTGSVGKTSTKEMIYSILISDEDTLKTQGNRNNEIGLPLTLFELEYKYKNCVLEMGMSDLGEISLLSKTAKPSVGVITNIGEAHIENLKTRENILKAKLEIVDGMDEQAPLILNGDDPYLADASSYVSNPIVYYSIKSQDCDVYATDIVQEKLSTRFTIHYYGKSVQAVLPTVGEHNVYNALAGFCVGLLCEISVTSIINSIKWYKNVGLRQRITECDGVVVIEDCYNASPTSMASMVDVLTSIECSGKRICVVADMLELGELSEELHIEVGKMIGRSKVDMLYCYGELSLEIKRGALLVGMKEVRHYEDKEKLLTSLKTKVTEGDVISFKGSRGMALELISEHFITKEV